MLDILPSFLFYALNLPKFRLLQTSPVSYCHTVKDIEPQRCGLEDQPVKVKVEFFSKRGRL